MNEATGINTVETPVRVADYIMQRLADYGVRHVFVVTGGGAMHLNDALGREKRIQYICNHNEQASTIAAEGYARVNGGIGVACVTSGPGGINALNGVHGAYTDSIPMLVVSGQMKRETLLRTNNLLGKLRQLGDQENDIVSMLTHITKYAQCIIEPESIRYHLERALYLAMHGRPGPCWLDVPLDVQGAMVVPAKMRAYDPSEDEIKWDMTVLRAQAADVAKRLLAAKRPALLGGTGVRLAGAISQFQELAARLQVPITTAWTHDLIPSDSPLFCGRQGTIGTRAGNLTVQNSDLLIIVGARMCIRQISYNWQSFARAAHTVQVDVDAAELAKPTFRAQQPIQADARLFLDLVLEHIPAQHQPLATHREWLAWCQERVHRFPNVIPHQRQAASGTINQYHLIELIFNAAKKGDIFVCGDATACITPFQAGHLKEGQRLFSNSGSASMGYDLPAALGAAKAANPGQRIICFAGDGSLQMNIQEMATVAFHKIPLTLFILNNGGYHSIRSTQKIFFQQFVGEGPESGVGFPDFVALARAYGLNATTLDAANPQQTIKAALAADGPLVVVCELDRSQTFEPKITSKKLADGRMVTAPMEDMAPFLDREELKRNMLIPTLD